MIPIPAWTLDWGLIVPESNQPSFWEEERFISPVKMQGRAIATELLVPDTRDKRLPGRRHRLEVRLLDPVTPWQPLRVLGEWNSVPQGNDGEGGMRGDQPGGLSSQQAPGMFNLFFFISEFLPGGL